MTASGIRLIAAFSCVAVAASSLAWQVDKAGGRRLYIEPFTTNAGSAALRDQVIDELRKLRSVSVVSGEANADAILGGGGEI